MIVTLSRQFGAGARTIGRELSHRLGCRLLDEDIRKLVAGQLGTSVDAVAVLDERLDPFGTRIMQSFAASVVPEADLWSEVGPEITADDVEEATRLVIADVAKHGSLVIVGRAARWILGDRHDALHVRLVAPFEARVERVAGREGVGHKRAEALARDADRARAAHIQRYYDADWEDPLNYHLVLNTGILSVPVSTDLIVEAARRLTERAPR